VFLSTFERQLDSKRRLVLPAEFRLAAAGDFNGVYCFPSLDFGCIEGGGQALRDEFAAMVKEYPRGHATRVAIQTSILAAMAPLAYDTAGRITLPETFCERVGLIDWVSVVGMGDSFQIWPRDAFAAHNERQRLVARDGIALRAEQLHARGMAA
jgi:MraZ protein